MILPTFKVRCTNTDDFTDVTEGTVYTATHLRYLSNEADGHLVTALDAIHFIDDVGDDQYTPMSLGFELVV